MSQLPRPDKMGLLESIDADLRQRDARELAVRGTQSNPFLRPTFDKDNNPTLLPQTTGFWGSIGARYDRDANALSALGVQKMALMSIPEMIAGSMGSQNIPAPYTDGNDKFVVDGVPTSSSEVRLKQVLDSAPVMAAVLRTYGLDEGRLQELRVNTAEDFAEFYPAIVAYQRNSQMLQSYNEDHWFLAGVAGTTHAVSNVILDPLFIAGLFFTGGTATAAREGIKTTAKEVTKKTVTSTARNQIGRVVAGPSGALLNRLASKQGSQSVVSHLLVTGGSAMAGGIYATSVDLAAQEEAIRLGQQDPDLKFNVLPAMIGVGFGAVLGEVSYRLATGSSMVPFKKAIHRHEDSASSLSAVRAGLQREAGERRGKPDDFVIDGEDITATDFVSNMAVELYDSSTANKLVSYFQNLGVLANTDMKRLAKYLTTFPTAEELLENVFAGKFLRTEVTYELLDTVPARANRLKEQGLKEGSGVLLKPDPNNPNVQSAGIVVEVTDVGLIRVKDNLSGNTNLIKPEDIDEFLPSGPFMGTDTSGGTKPDFTVVRDLEIPVSKYERLTRDINLNYQLYTTYRENKATKDANRIKKLLDLQIASREKLVQESFSLKKGDLGTHIRRHFQNLPIETSASPADRIDRVVNALWGAMKEGQESDTPKSLISRYVAKSKAVGSNWILPKQRAKSDIGSDNKVQSLAGSLWTVLSNKGFDSHEVIRGADGKAVYTAEERVRDMIDGPLARIQQHALVAKKAGYSNEDLYKIVMNNKINGTPVPAKLQPLVKEMNAFLSDLGKRGVDNRVIENILDSFFPVRMNRGIKDEALIRRSWRSAFYDVYFERFDPQQKTPTGRVKKDSQIDVNYRALQRNKFLIKTEDGIESAIDPLTGKPFFVDEDGNAFVPQSLADLPAGGPDSIRSLYLRDLKDSLLDDADESLSRFKGRSEEENSGVAAPVVVRTSSINTKESRILQQQIYVDQRVIDSGLLDLDVTAALRGYTKTTGYNIARNEALREATGDRTTWDEVVAGLRQLASSDDDATKAVERLVTQDKMVSGRFVIDEEFGVVGTVLSNLGATLVAGTVVPTIIASELGAQILRSVVSKGDLADHVTHFTETIRKVRDKDTLRRIHIRSETQHMQDRFWSDFTDHLPEKVRNNKAVTTSRGISILARKAFGETFFTEFGKSMAHSVTYMKLHTYRSKIPRIREALSYLKDNPDNGRGAARSAGVSYADFELMRQYGVLDEDMLDVAEKMLEIHPRMLASDKIFHDNVGSIANPKVREKAYELYQRLNRMAADDANAFVATPSPGDLTVSNNAVKNLLTSMMSFHAAFFNTTLTRIGKAPGWKQAGFFMYLAAAEVNNSILRDYLYNGKSLEEIEEEWREDPVKKLAIALTRMPVTAPMSLPAIGGYALAAGRPDLAVTSLSGGATPKLAANFVKGVMESVKSVYNGEPMSESGARNLRRSAPGYNNWMLRVLEKFPPLNDE